MRSRSEMVRISRAELDDLRERVKVADLELAAAEARGFREAAMPLSVQLRALADVLDRPQPDSLARPGVANELRRLADLPYTGAVKHAAEGWLTFSAGALGKITASDESLIFGEPHKPVEIIEDGRVAGPVYTALRRLQTLTRLVKNSRPLTVHVLEDPAWYQLLRRIVGERPIR